MVGWQISGFHPCKLIYPICFFVFESYLRPCLTHADHIGTDRSLLTGHNALLLRQIARDLLHALLHRYNNTWTAFFLTSRRHWWEWVSNTVIESHLSMTSGSSGAQTRTARLIDRDANNCAISPPPTPSEHPFHKFWLPTFWLHTIVLHISSALQPSSCVSTPVYMVYCPQICPLDFSTPTL